MEQCLFLHVLISKHTIANGCPLYAAFLDLSSAFDLVNRSKPWTLLRKMDLEEALVHFLFSLHSDLSAKVRFGNDGECSESFKLERG